MKIVMPGGSGHVGQALIRHLTGSADTPVGAASESSSPPEIVVLSRKPKAANEIAWDGRTLGEWAKAIDGADVVINLAGRSVNCRYSEANLKAMMDSRVDSTKVVGQAIAQASNPPRVWLQASTATIYAHRFDAANDEPTGILGGDEPGAPYKWNASIAIAKTWEAELDRAETPKTRKVAMRSAMTMSVDKGSVFDVLANLAKKGLGGQAGNGKQFVSWVHEDDFARAIQFLIERDDLDGPINICSPNPLPNREFMRILREAVRAKLALPTPAWLLEIGAVLIRTETELILKSRRVIPTRLLAAGFEFQFPEWKAACQDLVCRAEF